MVRGAPRRTVYALSLIHICVTLGGTGKDEGKRHPTIGDNVLIGTGCKVLGPITIGANSRIGANSVVLSCIPANATAIGIPACVVRVNGSKVARSSEELNQRDYPDMVMGPSTLQPVPMSTLSPLVG